MQSGCIKDAQRLHQRMQAAGAEWLHYRMQSGCIKGCTKQVQCLHQGDAADAEWLHYRMQSGCMKGCTAAAEWLP